MNRWMSRGLSLSLVALTASVMACDMSAAEEGAEGNLEFYYHPADGSTDFDRPMAMGSSMDMYVDAVDRDLDALIDAYAEPEEVLRASVAQDEDYAISLRAISPGDATLHAEVDSAGSQLSDHIAMRVDQVEQLAMEHECTSDDADAAYVAGQSIRIPMERLNANGDKLVGEAEASDGETTSADDVDTACQVWLYPEAYQSQTRCDEEGLHISAVDQFETIEIDPIDGVDTPSGNHPHLDVHVVEEQDIELLSVDGSLREGSSRSVELEAIAIYPHDMEICGGLELRIDILTPDICEGTFGRGTNFSIDAEDENSFRLRGLHPGFCEFAVEFEERPDLGTWYFDLDVAPED